MAKEDSSSTMSGHLEAAVVAAMGVGLQYLYTEMGDKLDLPAAHANKPHNTWEEFYPFYLSEHSDQTCKRLHFAGTTIICLMLLRFPGLALAMAAAGSIGYAVSACRQPRPHSPGDTSPLSIPAAVPPYPTHGIGPG